MKKIFFYMGLLGVIYGSYFLVLDIFQIEDFPFFTSLGYWGIPVDIFTILISGTLSYVTSPE